MDNHKVELTVLIGKKTIKSQKQSGKKNPKSKRIPNQNKNFAQDNLLQTCDIDIIQKKQGLQSKKFKNINLSPSKKTKSQKDRTEKKRTIYPASQTDEGQTINRKKKLKSINQESPEKEYIYVIDPQSKKMKKYLVHEDEDINFQLNSSIDFMPPFMSCDQDCDSTEEIVRKGVQHSKKDLINQINRRKKKIGFEIFMDKNTQKSSSTDSHSVGK